MVHRSDNVRLIDGHGGSPRRDDRRGQATEARVSRSPIWRSRPETTKAAARTLGVAVAIAVAYFLAARLGLALLLARSDVAVFWPASGIAAGILIVLGRRAVPALLIGVMVGTVAANLMSDRSLLTSLLKGFCNAGEALVAAWLIERWFGLPFRLESLPRVGGFLAAVALASAASAVGGAATLTSLHAHTTAPYGEVWREWFLSSWVGMVVVAPLIIGAAQTWRKPPPRKEWIEGVGALGLTAVACSFTMTQAAGSWLSFSPSAFVLPMLLWLTARCQPTFGMAGASFASAAIISATTFGIGRFGDAAVPIAHRVAGAQLAMMTVTLFTLVLAVLFAQRKGAEDRLAKERDTLRESEERLRLAQSKTGVGVWDWNLRTGNLTWTPELEALFGLKPGTVKRYADFRNRVHPDDIAMVEAKGDAAVRDRKTFFEIEFRIIREDGQVRWIWASGGVFYDEATGKPIRMLGNHVDINERKQAELALAERNAQLALAGQAVLVGSFAYESDLETMRVSEGYCAIHGLPEGTTETTRSQWLASIHPDDLERTKGFRARTFSDKRKVYTHEFRIVRTSGEVRWIESRGVISYDNGGQPRRVIGISIDVTERKQLEHHKNTLISELDHRVKNVLAIVSTVVSRTQETSGSTAEFVAALDGRIKSMATTHELLSSRHWQGVPLAELVRRELAPYAAADNTTIDGPDVVLSAEAGQTLAMVFHELATNAAKFGAFSVKSGRLSVRWNLREEHAESRLRIEWKESGGPTVAAPIRSGFGTSAVRELIPYELGGIVDYVLAPDGVVCKLEIPATWLSNN